MGTFIVTGRDRTGETTAYEIDAPDEPHARAEASSLFARIESVVSSRPSVTTGVEDLGAGSLTSLSESMLQNEPTSDGQPVHKFGEEIPLTPQELLQRVKSMNDIFRITALVAGALLTACFFLYFFVIHFAFERVEATASENLPTELFVLEVNETAERTRNVWLFWLILLGVIAIASLVTAIWARINSKKAQRLHDQLEGY